LSDAAERVVRIVDAERVEPDRGVQARYEECYQFYREAYFALLPVFERAARPGAERPVARPSLAGTSGYKQ
jgi:hypothetical protein